VALLLVVLIIFPCHWLFSVPDGSRITEANYERIDLGMSSAKVEEILGRPHRITIVDSTWGKAIRYGYYNGKSQLNERNRMSIELVFRDGTVHAKNCGDGYKPSAIEQMRYWIRDKTGL
jgi:hypothetical protein